eukprot:scaffold110551_cov36-Tisochrysis_lutea.AAC.2
MSYGCIASTPVTSSHSAAHRSTRATHARDRAASGIAAAQSISLYTRQPTCSARLDVMLLLRSATLFKKIGSWIARRSPPPIPPRRPIGGRSHGHGHGSDGARAANRSMTHDELG